MLHRLAPRSATANVDRQIGNQATMPSGSLQNTIWRTQIAFPYTSLTADAAVVEASFHLVT